MDFSSFIGYFNSVSHLMSLTTGTTAPLHLQGLQLLRLVMNLTVKQKHTFNCLELSVYMNISIVVLPSHKK